MKTTNKKSLVVGKPVRYYRKSVGLLHAKRRPTPRMLMQTVLSLVLVAGLTTAIYSYVTKPPVQRTDAVEVSIAPKESDTKDADLEQAPAQAKEDESLAKEIQTQLKDKPKDQKWSIFVRDLKSNRMASINADELRPGGNLSKLFVLPALETKLPVKNWNSKLGQSTISNCVLEVIKLPNSECSEPLGTYVGWQYVDKYNQQQGFTKTTLATTTQKTTARETGDLLYRLQNGQIMSDKARRLFFDGFYMQKSRSGIPAGCGQDCLVGNKTGDDGTIKNDAAVVRHGSSQYIIVIMSQNASWEDVARVGKIVDSAMLP